jgi:outer membrane receptor protein involved in Fe transport
MEETKMTLRSLEATPKRNRDALHAGLCATVVLVFVVALPVFCAPSIYAQVRTADIVGIVADSSGARVPGATVTATNLGTNQARTAVSDNSGNYLLTLLPPGQYRVVAELSGFKTWTAPAVALAAGDRVALDPVLEVGRAEESIEVTAEAPALQTQSVTLGSLVDAKAMQDLPLNNRNFVVLAQLTPGANDSTIGFGGGNGPDDRRRTSQITVNGQFAWANNFMIDGMDNNERAVGTTVVKPSVEAVQEMQIQTNVYSAELGRTAGGAVNLITRSGTNAVHGSLFEFFRNERLDANNFFALTKAPYRQNQFGGSVGGPFVKDRTFFFGAYEAERVAQGRTFTTTVPTMAMRAGNFGGVARVFDPLTTTCVGTSCTRTEFANGQIPADRLSPAGVRLVNLYPEPTTGGLANNFTYSPSETFDQDTVDVRIDHRVSDRSSVFGRYTFADTRSFLPPAIPIGDGLLGGNTNQRTQGAQVHFLRTFGTRTIVELRGGYSRYDIDSLSYNPDRNLSDEVGIRNSNIPGVPSTTGLARIAVSGYSTMGDGFFVPVFNTNDVFQAGASVTHQRGAHNIKYGVDVRKRHLVKSQSGFPRGQFTFNPTLTVDNPLNPSIGTGNAVASLLLGYPFLVSRDLNFYDHRYRFAETGAYVQDDWRLRQWLTLNLGIRHDYYSPVTEADDNLTNIDLAAGRIIQAGQDGVSRTAGVQKDWINFAPRVGLAATFANRTVVRGGYGVSFVPPFFGLYGTMRNPPFTSLFASVPASITPTATLSDGLPPVIPTSPSNPTGDLYNVQFDSELPYVHQFNVTVQHELPLQLIASVSYVGQRGKKQFMPNNAINVNAPTPGDPRTALQRRPFFAVFPNAAAINSEGNAITSGETRYNALQITLDRRFSDGLGVVASYVLAHAEDNFDWRPTPRGIELVWGDSALDVRHRFTLRANYLLPFAQTATGIVGALARGWQVNVIGVAQTSTPFTVTNNADINGTGGARVQDRPNLVGNPELPASDRSILRWFNTSAFARQTVGTYGSAGRNILRGPNFVSMDLSASKTFDLTGTTDLQFTVQAFNALNRTNFGLPNGSLGSPAFGRIGSAGAPRQMQLALKVTF